VRQTTGELNLGAHMEGPLRYAVL